MSEYSDFPGVRVESGSMRPMPSTHRYEHIDDFETYDGPNIQLHLYAFDGEDRREELLEAVHDLRENFVFATVIIWPDEMREEVEQADTFRLHALEWACAVSRYMDVEPDELSRIADQAEAHIREQ